MIALLTIILVVVSRGIGVWTPIKFLSFFKTFEKNTALIITWGGLRGGLSIALALNLPDQIGEGKKAMSLHYGYPMEGSEKLWSERAEK